MSRTWIEISKENIIHNHLQIREIVGKDTEIYAVIKADAYGHGAIEVAKLMSDYVSGFAVASVYEAIELRKEKIKNEIVILGGTFDNEFELLIENNIIPSIFTLKSALAYSAAANDRKVRCWIAVDTGMSRIGFPDDIDGLRDIKEISKLDNIEISGVFSHYAKADEKDKSSANDQTQRFNSFIEKLKSNNIKFGKRSLANSASILDLPEKYDIVREGIVLYGIYPSDEINNNNVDIRPALEFKTVVEMIKYINPGTGVSYGHTFVANKKIKIATLCCGYADGIPRLLSNKGCAIIRGKKVPIIGRICMDQMMVDVTDIETICEGDIATIIGKDGESEITVYDIAKQANTIPYEILTGLSRLRIPKIYK